MKDKQQLKEKKSIPSQSVSAAVAKQIEGNGGKKPSRPVSFESLTKPTAEFTRTLAAEIVKNLVSIGRFTKAADKEVVITNASDSLGHRPVFIDTSVLIDGRILPVVNSGFYCGTLLVPKFVLSELQHIADSSDPVRRTKGRRGLEVVEKLQKQKVNNDVKLLVVSDDPENTIEVDHKLVELAKHHDAALMTVDFNLAKLARVQHVRVFNLGDLSQALKVLAVPGEELVVKITHEGKERQQGVGYLTDGTMVVVDDARSLVNSDVPVIITKIHQTPAGQLLFARIRG